MNSSSTKRSEAYIGEVLRRLTRIETRVTRGFETIGIDTYDSREWLSVDPATSTIYVSTMGRTLQVINDSAKAQGAAVGKVYEIVWRGDVKATIQIY